MMKLFLLPFYLLYWMVAIPAEVACLLIKISLKLTLAFYLGIIVLFIICL